MLIYHRPDQPEWYLGARHVTEDGRYLLIYARHGTRREHGLFYMDLHAASPKRVERQCWPLWMRFTKGLTLGCLVKYDESPRKQYSVFGVAAALCSMSSYYRCPEKDLRSICLIPCPHLNARCAIEKGLKIFFLKAILHNLSIINST